ncbi:iron ABC transporter permease [Marivibrio halodurans]|uniref:Iron ABC transporter permease n=1 Tax=Marivibrio halodurans TaxID=2039722 RepID=A0A8J7SPK7_9PROT|nr:iron ABC transporter permease [Marivibrio halodurans]MBP5858411.1 iron ABC transporter permease [Marivibrio halodurans]
MSEREATLLNRFTRIKRRRVHLAFALALGLIAVFLLDLSAGPAALGLGDIVRGLFDPGSLELRDRIILWDVRLPDALIALAVGAALGLAGVETQTILDNPLASPFTLGVSSAAVLGASVAIVLAPSIPAVPDHAILPALALLFALASGGFVLLVVRVSEGSRETVVLFGIALVFLCNALTAGFHMVAEAEAVQQIVFWTIGNLTKAGWAEVAMVFACVAVILPFSLRHVWLLTLLRGGEAHARSMGIDIARLRTMVILRSSVLAAFAVCFVGAIGFIGLVAPHLARLMFGEDHRLLVPGAALCGALVLSAASYLSKALVPGIIIPVGILTAVVGVPVLLLLLWRARRRA